MRCLTLADALRQKGARCTFVCRLHAGHLLDLVAKKGHKAHALSEPLEHSDAPADPPHAAWLGASSADDAEQTKRALAGQTTDWLVVDHYALDARWEQALRPRAKRIMVMDDLADRPHACDLLLDQTFGRKVADYIPHVPEGCQLLCGSQYALLRPEFLALREYSLKRRAKPALKELLINMGGVDKDNLTGAVLRVLKGCLLPEGCKLNVVIGKTAPRLKDVQNLASQMPWPTRVFVGVENMAQLMADSDLAIGAAGATSWERCCLGLPSISCSIANNQNLILKNLARSRSIMVLDSKSLDLKLQSIIEICTRSDTLLELSSYSSKITDGHGVNRVLEMMHD
jgi:UDP-2,4-diacetamido-2,4,6-trideoxy-beta-L-altropyranose hydrolase